MDNNGNCIAGTSGEGIYYSCLFMDISGNVGSVWSQATDTCNNIIGGSFKSVSMDNSGNCIAASFTNGIYYSNLSDSSGNVGSVWKQAVDTCNNIIGGTFYSVSMDNSGNCIAGSFTNGIYYSNLSDSSGKVGSVWSQANNTIGRTFNLTYMDNNGNCIAAPNEGYLPGIWYSNLSADTSGNVGSVWSEPTDTSGIYFTSLCIDNSGNCIAGASARAGDSTSGIYYSNLSEDSSGNVGSVWKHSAYPSSVYVESVYMDNNGNCIAGTTTNAGIYYSNLSVDSSGNVGSVWKKSGLNSKNLSFYSVFIDNSGNCIAGSDYGIYYSNLSSDTSGVGSVWQKAVDTSGIPFGTLFMDNNGNCIACTNTGILYSNLSTDSSGVGSTWYEGQELDTSGSTDTSGLSSLWSVDNSKKSSLVYMNDYGNAILSQNGVLRYSTNSGIGYYRSSMR